MGSDRFFNLVDEPWIAVPAEDGTLRSVGLAELFTRAEHISDVAVRPHERVALMRLLICLCCAACPDEEPPSLAAVVAYLQAWKDRFWLYHPKYPFLQTAGLKPYGKGGLTPFSKLDITRAAGANAALFDHVGERARPSPAELATALLTYQCFSPGGLISRVDWNGEVTSKSSCDAPCIPGSMLHVFIRGRTLAETLRLNTVPPALLRQRYGSLGPGWLGRPVWECVPEHSGHKAAADNATRTFLGRLAPLARAVLLQEDGMLHGAGLSYPGFAAGFPAEPSAAVLRRPGKKEEETALLAFRPERAVWRELPALLASVGAESGREGLCAPPALACLRGRNGDDRDYELVAVGVARDQADILDSVESVYPLRRTLLSEKGRRGYEAGVEYAEAAARRLGAALGRFRANLDGSRTGASSGAGRRDGFDTLYGQGVSAFWTHVEQEIGLLFRSACTEAQEGVPEPDRAWKRLVRRAALDAYDLVCGGVSGRYEQAYVRGRRCLTERPGAFES